VRVNSLRISKYAELTITDGVALYIASNSTVEYGGTLTIKAYIGALDGSGDLRVQGFLNLTSGNVQGTGALIIDPSGNFSISSSGIRESYLLRNVTIYGNAAISGVAHVGFWWQPGNVSITVANGGVVRTLQGGFFMKIYEGFGVGASVPFRDSSGTILVQAGGTFYFGSHQFFVYNVVNFGTVYLIAMCLPPVAKAYCNSFPYGVNLMNFGTIQYYSGNDPVTVSNCLELERHIATQNNGDIIIDLEPFAAVGPLICENSPVLTVSDAKITFKGKGGLIFGMRLVLENSVLELEENVDVVFIKEFHATDSLLHVPHNSEMKLMFMPFNEAAGYHNYLDKSVMIWPEDQKKIKFSGVQMTGGGAIEFLSELNLPKNEFLVKSGEIYFQREFNASALTGSGNFIVGAEGYASLGIESSFVGEGKIEIYGRVEVPELSSVINDKVVIVHDGGKFDVEGQISGRSKVVYF
jgi:hypothetical protein